MFFLIYAQRWKVTKTIYERYDSCEVEFNALCCIGYPVIVSSVITERKGHKKRLIQRSQSRFNNHKGGNCSGKLPLMFRFGQINASSERLTVLCLRLKKRNKKALFVLLVMEGPSVSTSLDVKNQKRYWRKKSLLCCTVCLIWKKIDVKKKEDGFIFLFFDVVFFVFSCVSCPFK